MNVVGTRLIWTAAQAANPRYHANPAARRLEQKLRMLRRVRGRLGLFYGEPLRFFNQRDRDASIISKEAKLELENN